MSIQILVVVCWLITLLLLNWAGRFRADHRNKIDQTPKPCSCQGEQYRCYVKQTTIFSLADAVLFCGGRFWHLDVTKVGHHRVNLNVDHQLRDDLLSADSQQVALVH